MESGQLLAAKQFRCLPREIEPDPEERKSQAQMADELEISRFTTSKQERVAMMQIRQAAAHDKYDMADVA